ncbi:MAG: hypothetical protein JSS12_06880, partial [Verrucomicrobia bacterium]|nr:hypothetical protein [Verrucomicrobiota bacterium]
MKYLVILALFVTTHVAAVENSIISVMEHFENIENLQQAKYNEAHFRK